MKAWRRCCLFALSVGLLLLVACAVPRVRFETIHPTAPPSTPAPLPKREPTPYASGRVSGKVCLAQQRQDTTGP